jgi:hypothetical protein
MDETPTRRSLPWGPALTVVALAAGAFLLAPAGGETGGAAALAVGAAFVAGRWLLGYFWGLVLALLLGGELLFARTAGDVARPALAEGLVLSALALSLAACILTFAPRVYGKGWLAVAVLLPAVAGAAWEVSARAGVVVSLAGGLSLFGAAVLALVRRRSSAWNALLAVAVGVAASGGGLLVGVLRDVALPDLSGGLSFASGLFTADALARWAWPSPWLTLPLAVWGWWLTIRRGRRLWAANRTAVTWVLTLYAPVDFLSHLVLSPAEAADYVGLAALCLVLAVFCVGDLVRGIGERIVLAPPQTEENGR